MNINQALDRVSEMRERPTAMTDEHFAAVLAEESWGEACIACTHIGPGYGWWHFRDKARALQAARRPWWKRLLR